MAFDNPEPEWRAALKEMSQNIIHMAEEVEKLRMAIAPLLEQRRRNEEYRQMIQEEHDRAFKQLNESTLGITMRECDCSPNRTAALAGQFSTWVNDQIAQYNNKKN